MFDYNSLLELEGLELDLHSVTSIKEACLLLAFCLLSAFSTKNKGKQVSRLQT